MREHGIRRTQAAKAAVGPGKIDEAAQQWNQEIKDEESKKEKKTFELSQLSLFSYKKKTHGDRAKMRGNRNLEF